MTGFLGARHAIKGTLLAGCAGAFLSVVAFAGVQTARLEGFHVWPVSVTGWKKTAQDAQATIDRIELAQIEAAEAARLARIAKEDAYRQIAERIDDNAKQSLDTALDAADRFIAAGGLRASAAGSAPCSARTGAADYPAADPDRTGRTAQLDAAGAGAGDLGAPAGGLVLVSAADVRICTRNTVKAEAGRDLALQLEHASANE
ncbi:hypothetical protein [Qipengyuania citrea]|uniref:hypothetical protein n=1 Tax=Qipengyuania citrea TaxID=225971 RepID=UPI00209F98B1|nr:hypothetical protein [Qipengyuania citrea]MCP2016846.1 enoyl-CoA hydratase/carnithine racemase [Qipengyuania citrea]